MVKLKEERVMANVEIIGFPQSTYVRAARMACEEKGVAYELKPAPPHSPEVLAIHPFGKIPAMRHGDFELFESKAIATYLDQVFPGPRLIPQEARAAALAEQWISAVNTVIDRTLVRTYLFSYVFPNTPDGAPDRKTIDEVTPDVRKQIELLDRAVAKTGYLAGDQLSFADINLMPILFYVRKFPEGSEALTAAKHLAAYYDRNAKRPSFLNTDPPPVPSRQSTPAERKAG
jgi:glutathione S-transferase